MDLQSCSRHLTCEVNRGQSPKKKTSIWRGCSSLLQPHFIIQAGKRVEFLHESAALTNRGCLTVCAANMPTKGSLKNPPFLGCKCPFRFTNNSLDGPTAFVMANSCRRCIAVPCQAPTHACYIMGCLQLYSAHNTLTHGELTQFAPLH